MQASQLELRHSDTLPIDPLQPAREGALLLRVIQCGRSYCGKPFLQLPNRDDAVDGCGCPTIAKAKDGNEHCPIDVRHQPCKEVDGSCNCKWCVKT